MLDLDKRALVIIQAILRKYVPEYEVHIFGSRVTGKAKRFSDVDLVLIGKVEIPWQRLESLKDAFSESNLPMSVDVIDSHAVAPEFMQAIMSEAKVIQSPID
jgi:predicted nucleotidyltransferase